MTLEEESILHKLLEMDFKSGLITGINCSTLECLFKKYGEYVDKEEYNCFEKFLINKS